MQEKNKTKIVKKSMSQKFLDTVKDPGDKMNPYGDYFKLDGFPRTLVGGEYKHGIKPQYYFCRWTYLD